MAEIGKRIRYQRESLGLTQEELAQKLGYKNKSTIAKIENGTNDIVQSKVIDFANVLNTTAAYLMGWSEKGQSSSSPYDLDDETRQIAQEIYENPELRTLFHEARDISPKRLKAYVDFMKSMKAQDDGNNDEG